MRLPLPGHASLLRDRGGHESGRVTYLELFFDLVFVFAVTQLSHTLLEHLDLRGVLETGLLLLAMWWTWTYTTWVTNWLDPGRGPVRVMLIALMLGCLLLSTSIPRAYEDTAALFAVTYVVLNVGRSLFMVWAMHGHRAENERNFQRITAWFVASAPFWLLGAAAEGDWRLALWAVAVAIEYAGPMFGFAAPGLGRSDTTTWDIDPGHMAERCGLFVIIALGESILTSGATFSGLDRTGAEVAAFGTAFLGSVVMWWIYFVTCADQASRHLARSADPGRVARLAYTYVHILIVAAIIVVAVGDELVLAHPDGHAAASTVATLVGGPLVFLAGTLLFKLTAGLGRVPVSHVVGVALLLVTLPFAGELSPLTLSWLTTGVLVVVGAWETVAARRHGDLADQSLASGSVAGD